MLKPSELRSHNQTASLGPANASTLSLYLIQTTSGEKITLVAVRVLKYRMAVRLLFLKDQRYTKSNVIGDLWNFLLKGKVAMHTFFDRF